MEYGGGEITGGKLIFDRKEGGEVDLAVLGFGRFLLLVLAGEQRSVELRVFLLARVGFGLAGDLSCFDLGE